MSHQFDFDSTNRILCCRFDDHVTDEVRKEFYRVAAEHFAQIDPCRGINDFSAVASFEVSPRIVCKMAGYALPCLTRAAFVSCLRRILAPRQGRGALHIAK
jgi:hypothetical protein